ncbi:MAG: hypothetical protein ACLFVU_03970 [Phycisphaerae bacterium]
MSKPKQDGNGRSGGSGRQRRPGGKRRLLVCLAYGVLLAAAIALLRSFLAEWREHPLIVGALAGVAVVAGLNLFRTLRRGR